MNETFSDLSIYQNLHANYQGPQFFKSLSDTLQRGVLYVSAFGGGTCNTEFEYLTGNSMAFLGTGTYPYTIYDLTLLRPFPSSSGSSVTTPLPSTPTMAPTGTARMSTTPLALIASLPSRISRMLRNSAAW